VKAALLALSALRGTPAAASNRPDPLTPRELVVPMSLDEERAWLRERGLT
jgi:hypothetical protein